MKQQHKLICLIQGRFRCYAAQTKFQMYKRILQNRVTAATKIQTRIRSYWARYDVNEMLVAKRQALAQAAEETKRRAAESARIEAAKQERIRNEKKLEQEAQIQESKNLELRKQLQQATSERRREGE